MGRLEMEGCQCSAAKFLRIRHAGIGEVHQR